MPERVLKFLTISSLGTALFSISSDTNKVDQFSCPFNGRIFEGGDEFVMSNPCTYERSDDSEDSDGYNFYSGDESPELEFD